MKLETLAVHGGKSAADDPDVAPPIHLSSTFKRDADGAYPSGYVYGRTGNPNRQALEKCLAALEGGAAAAAFASGSAATGAVLRALRPGDHVLAPIDLYHGTRRLMREVLAPWGLEISFVDMTDLDAVRAALRPDTRLIWVETPSNPLLQIIDIAAVAGIAHAAGALCVCDNTWPTPILQRPFACGADLVVHATTKYLGGHSDVIGGAVIACRDDEFFGKIKAIQSLEGAVPAPFDCWLVLRGIRTLPLRMNAHCHNGAQVAAFLHDHRRVARVHYPGLATHQGHATAARQMSGFGGMMSFEVRGDEKDALQVAAKVRLWTRATSLGGVESLIEHRASVEGPNTATPRTLIRLSTGIENIDDLLEDLGQALEPFYA